MVRGAKIRFVSCGPPCTTFSLARCPKIRNLSCPWGFQVLDEATLLRNLHAVPCFLLSVIQFEIGPLFCHGATCVGVHASFGPLGCAQADGLLGDLI